MELYNTYEEYIGALEERGALPEGFRTSVVPLTFFPEEREFDKPLPMNMSLIMLDRPTEKFAAVFTSNRCPGAPVIIGRKRLGNKQIRGIIINNKIANVCIRTGVEDSLSLTEKLAETVGADPEEFFPCSTGIIGWRLPAEEMKKNIPALVAGLEGGTAVKLAKGIMTTDAFPKLRSVQVGSGRIVAVAKGAGMIEPNMATMLAYIMTDIDMERDFLRKCLSRVVNRSFNCISVDSDQSTSDTAILLSSGTKPAVSEELFEEALITVCAQLAEDIVRNAEGTGHVIKVEVTGACDDATAKAVGKAVINSPLVTTAVFGNDPNVGRLVSSVGDYMGNHGLDFDKDRMLLKLGDETVFMDGAFCVDKEKEEKLSAYMKERALDSDHKTFPAHNLTVDVFYRLSEEGTGCATVKGTDLSYGYVKENADYRS